MSAAEHTTEVRTGTSAGPNNQFATWYVARCSCGWAGRARSTEAAGADDAAAHLEQEGAGS